MRMRAPWPGLTVGVAVGTPGCVVLVGVGVFVGVAGACPGTGVLVGVGVFVGEAVGVGVGAMPEVHSLT